MVQLKKCFAFLSVAFLILLTACQSETAGEAEQQETKVEQKTVEQTDFERWGRTT